MFRAGGIPSGQVLKSLEKMKVAKAPDLTGYFKPGIKKLLLTFLTLQCSNADLITSWPQKL